MSVTEHEVSQLGHGELVAAGLLSQAVAELRDIAEFLRDDRLSFNIDDMRLVTWTTPAYADVEFGRNYRGVAIFNLDTTNDLRVGFAATQGLAHGPFLVSARGFLVLPILTSHVSVGGAGGTAGSIVIGLSHAPAVAAGKF